MEKRQAKKMFDELDKKWVSMRTMAVVFIALDVIACMIGGFVIIVQSNDLAVVGVVVWLIGSISAVVAWTSVSYALASAMDLKLIRNKLYDVDNRQLKYIMEDSYGIEEEENEKKSSKEEN